MKYAQDSGDQSFDQSYIQLPTINNKNAAGKRRAKPIIANLIDTQYEVVQQVCYDLSYNIVFQKQLKSWDLKWTDSVVSVQVLSKLQSHQKINHFPGMSVLSRKNNLAKNILKMQLAFPQQYNFVPKTFLLPSELGLFKTYVNQTRRRGYTKTFIVKPEASCQGRGIFLSQSPSQIQGNGQCVVQTYIDNPLLYKGLKFDLRIYVLVAGCDPLRIYIYNQGLVRFATQKYEPVDEENIDNYYMHLTNYAINKDNPRYVFNQSLQNLSHGHKKSLAQFFQTLKGLGLPAHEYWSNIKDTIVKTLIAGQPHLQHEYRMAQPHNIINNMCFQILGFDFMMDDRNKLYLLQINYTPSFSTQTPLDHLIKSNLIRDSLILMNVTPTARNLAQRLAKQELDKRVYTGKSTKVSPVEREKIVRDYQKARDQFQKKHLGSFQRIYPSRNNERQSRYLNFLDHSVEDYKQSTSPQRNVGTRRSNSKYRIKRMISHHTITEQQNVQNDSPHQNIKAVRHQGNINPENKDKNTVFTRKLRQKLNFNEAIHINNSQIISQHVSPHQNISKLTGYGQQIRGMDLSSLQTKNQQSTMFSKHYAQQTSG